MRMQGNWDRITKKYGGTQQGGFIRYVLTLVNLPPISISKSRTLLLPSISWTPLLPGDQFASNEKAAEFSRFFATRKKPEFERTLKQSLENVRVNARWIQGIRSEPRLAQTVQELLHRPWSAFGWVAGGVAGNKVPADGMRLYILSVKKVVSPCKSTPSPSMLVKEGSRFEHRHGLKKNFDLNFFTIKNL